MATYSFSQVDVFGSASTDRQSRRGGARRHRPRRRADGGAFARWTNLSETTFLLPPRIRAADYRLRIFTPAEELPFAGHPTLGSAHAWLESGGTPASEGRVVQECGVGLVELRRDEDALSFRAPAFLRIGPVDEETLARASRSLGVEPGRVVARGGSTTDPAGWASSWRVPRRPRR